MKRILVLTVALLMILQVPAYAQGGERPAVMGQLGDMLSASHGAAAPGAAQFKPSGQTPTLVALADRLGQTPEQRQALRKALVEGARRLEVELAKVGKPNNAAAAVAFALSSNWAIYTNTEIADDTSDALLAQAEKLFGSSKMASLTNAQKQEIYEYCIGMGLFAPIMREAAGSDAQAVKNVRALAGGVLEQMLGVPLRQISITAKGLQIAAAPGSGGVSPGGAQAAGHGAAHASGGAGLTCQPGGAGWSSTPSDTGLVLEKTVATRNAFNEPLRVRVIVGPGVSLSDSADSATRALFDKGLRPLIPADVSAGNGLLRDATPDLCRRIVGNGLRARFCGVSWSKKAPMNDPFGTSQELHLYLVESGGAWHPVFVTLTGMEGDRLDGPGNLFGRDRYTWVEEALGGLRGSPSGKPLFTAAEMAGTYQLNATTGGPFYYNGLTGASMGSGFQARNNILALSANGTYALQVAGASGIGGVQQVNGERQGGPFQISTDARGAFLDLRRRDGTLSRQRLMGIYAMPNGRKVLVVLPPDAWPGLQSVWASGDHYFSIR